MDVREIRRINATKHGGYGTRLYGIWNSMRQRCTNPSVKEYRYYGAKDVRAECARNGRSLRISEIGRYHKVTLTISLLTG